MRIRYEDKGRSSIVELSHVVKATFYPHNENEGPPFLAMIMAGGVEVNIEGADALKVWDILSGAKPPPTPMPSGY